MKLRDKIAAVISASMLAVTAWAIPAYAGGSDDPTPYTVDEDGITLAPGDAFEDCHLGVGDVLAFDRPGGADVLQLVIG